MAETERQETLTGVASPWAVQSQRGVANSLAFVIAWSAEQPERVGEVAFLPESGPAVLGRGPSLADDPAPRVAFTPQRPGATEIGVDLLGAQISRRQTMLRTAADGRVSFERIGACRMLVDGQLAHDGTLQPGQVLTLHDQLVLLCVARPRALPASHFPDRRLGPFGFADTLGIVGESATAWRMRDALTFIGASEGHVLILGESGVGKEVAARAVHALSRRNKAPLVARSAATIPDSLVDAELFGNVGNYPNPGMRDRPGLIGEADGATLFLDEIGELPQPMQARLLRVLDSGGEYTRLGEARNRRSDFRLVAATNRNVDDLKQDFAARLKLRVTIPGLNERREDIPLLIRHLLSRAAATNPNVAQRFYDPHDAHYMLPRISPYLVERLLRHQYRLHVRELDALLWHAILTSPDDFIALTDEVEEEMAAEVADDGRDDVAVDADAIRTAMERSRGNVSRAAKELGLRNRYVLYRLMKRYGIRP